MGASTHPRNWQYYHKQIQARIQNCIDDRRQEPKRTLLSNFCQRAPVRSYIRPAIKQQSEEESNRPASSDGDESPADDVECFVRGEEAAVEEEDREADAAEDEWLEEEDDVEDLCGGKSIVSCVKWEKRPM